MNYNCISGALTWILFDFEILAFAAAPSSG